MSTKRRLLASTTVMVPFAWPTKIKSPVVSNKAEAVTMLLLLAGLLLLASPSAQDSQDFTMRTFAAIVPLG